MFGGYKAMFWKVRILMLTLYQIEALPQSNMESKMRVYGEYEPSYDDMYNDDDFGHATIAGELIFKELMMRYYYLLSDLTQEGWDIRSMQYMADLGFAFCSPYLTWEDLEEWKENSDNSQHHQLQWFVDKLKVISGILDREGMQFERRAVDNLTDLYLMDEDEEMFHDDELEEEIGEIYL